MSMMEQILSFGKLMEDKPLCTNLAKPFPESPSGLDGLIESTSIQPPRIILYGLPGVGKTTFAAGAGSVLIDCEGGAGAIPGLARTPTLATWTEIEFWLRKIAASNDTRPVAVDTLDWMVRRIVEYVTIDLDGKTPGDVTNTISSAHGGYFKARDIVLNVVHRTLLPALNHIVDSGRPVIILAHAINQKLTTPEGYDISTAAPDLGQWIMPTFTEWADCVLYASIEQDQRMARSVSSNLIMAKNRYSLPERFQLDWSTLIRFISGTKKQGEENG